MVTRSPSYRNRGPDSWTVAIQDDWMSGGRTETGTIGLRTILIRSARPGNMRSRPQDDELLPTAPAHEDRT